MILDLSSVLSEQHNTIEQTVPVETDVFRCETGSFKLVKKLSLFSLVSLVLIFSIESVLVVRSFDVYKTIKPKPKPIIANIGINTR